MRTWKSAMGAAVLAATAMPAVALTLEEVIDKHIEARGGGQAWEAVESMRVSGSFTAFSMVSPFTLHRKRDRKYHIDHVLDGKQITIGAADGKVWWDNHWRQVGATEVGGPDLQAVTSDLHFATALFDWEELGYRAKLIGETEIEGIPAVGVELTRPDESAETWYLDPDSYLEIARVSPGSDFGRAMPQRTFYDDFRPVGDVVLPHLVESQWYTRDRVARVDRVELNLPIDDSLFAMPAPLGMGPLLPIVGTWKVATAQRQQPQAPWQESESTSKIDARMSGVMLQEHFRTPQGEVLRTVSYDQHREHYRMTEIVDQNGYMDILQGTLGEDGNLLVSNVDTGTTWQGFGMNVHQRMKLFDITEDGFRIETEMSIDGGENWWVAAKATYTRSEPEE